MLWHSTQGLFTTSADDTLLRQWDVKTGRIVGALDLGSRQGYPQNRGRLSLSPDGLDIAIHTRTSVLLYSISARAVRRVITKSGPNHDIASSRVHWHPDGKRLATNLVGGTVVWSGETGEVLWTGGFKQSTAPCAWTPDGAALICANGVRYPDGQFTKPPVSPEVIKVAQCSSDAHPIGMDEAGWFWSIGLGCLSGFDSGGGAGIPTEKVPTTTVPAAAAMSSNGERIVWGTRALSGISYVKLYDRKEKTLVLTLSDPIKPDVRAVAANADISTLAVGGSESVVRVFAASGSPVVATEGPAVADEMRYSHGGEVLLIRDQDRKLWALSPDDGRTLWTQNNVVQFLLTADGTHLVARGLSGSAPGPLRWLKISTGELTRELTLEGELPAAMCLSPDGATVFGTYGGITRIPALWDAGTGKKMPAPKDMLFPVAAYYVETDLLLLSSHGKLQRYDLSAGSPMFTVETGLTKGGGHHLLSQTGARFAYTSGHSVVVLDTATGTTHAKVDLGTTGSGLGSAPVPITFSPETSSVVVRKDGELVFVQLASNKEVRRIVGDGVALSGQPSAPVVVARGAFLVATD